MSEKGREPSPDPDQGTPATAHGAEIIGPDRPSHWQIVFHQALLTPAVLKHKYKGSGTEEDPYLVEFVENDPANAMMLPEWKKWSLTMLVAFATLAVAFVSSAYSGGARQILKEFQVSSELVTAGISLFVLGFAIGPLFWAPLSELYGRQVLFFVSYCGLTAFNAGAAGAPDITTLLVLRFFAGAFGSSPLTNAGGVIADMFPASKRGLAMSVFAAAPFMGPVLGPVVGGFLGASKGWRWVEGLLAIFSGVLWILMTFFLPETYGPALLRRRAVRLSKHTGKVYLSKMEAHQGKISAKNAFKTAISRPWILLFREPIVFLLSIYMAIIYGTLYMMFGAFPIVYQQLRGWSEGIGGLAFVGVAVGMLSGVGYTLYDNKAYIRVQKAHGGFAPPEARLPVVLIGSICIPVGLFWFAWTNGPSIHWLASIAAGVPFGAGMVLVFLGTMNYLIDSYTVFAASVLAASSVLRSLFGAAFPLFTMDMYKNLGVHWASSIPAFLALACTPFPFLFYRYGRVIREKCKFAAESAEIMERLRGQHQPHHAHKKDEEEGDVTGGSATDREENEEARKKEVEERDTTGESSESQDDDYEDPETMNPFDIDRVISNQSFASQRLETVEPRPSLKQNVTTGRVLKPPSRAGAPKDEPSLRPWGSNQV